jgi:linoleate 9S-lipoxygenase
MHAASVQEFPPRSLDPSKYGDHTSTTTAAHIEKNLERLTVQQALDGNRLCILDHHDNFMPFLVSINNLPGNFIYATRTLLCSCAPTARSRRWPSSSGTA